jgi:hypothetical protein
MPAYVQGPPYPRGLYSGDRGFSFGALTGKDVAALAIAAAPGGLVRNANGTVTATTSAAHKALVGEIATVLSLTAGAAGTRFDGNYIIQAAPSGTTLTLLPVDDALLHQAVDTGGGGTIALIQGEQPAALTAGRAFGLVREGGSDATPTFFYAQGKFDGAPGVFEVDIQLSDIDVDGQYQTAANMNITTVDATNFTFRAAVQDQAHFIRMFLRSRTNAVNFWGWLRG